MASASGHEPAESWTVLVAGDVSLLRSETPFRRATQP